MTTIIVLLLAAILITLLGVWGKIPGCILGILGIVIWVVLIGVTVEYVGGFGPWSFGLAYRSLLFWCLQFVKLHRVVWTCGVIRSNYHALHPPDAVRPFRINSPFCLMFLNNMML